MTSQEHPNKAKRTVLTRLDHLDVGTELKLPRVIAYTLWLFASKALLSFEYGGPVRRRK